MMNEPGHIRKEIFVCGIYYFIIFENSECNVMSNHKTKVDRAVEVNLEVQADDLPKTCCLLSGYISEFSHPLLG